MTIGERKEREKEEMRRLILDTAADIIAKEGFEKLSIRKIANLIDYSPAIIYHYFHDKDEIVSQVMQQGYKKIINALSKTDIPAEPGEKLKALTRNLISTALKMPDEYKAVQLNTSPAILEFTASLFKGAAAKKPALGILVNCLKEIYKGNMDDLSLELTAQVIAASTFGIIIKLIIEKDIGEEQRAKLIEHFVSCIVDGMILGKSLGK